MLSWDRLWVRGGVSYVACFVSFVVAIQTEVVLVRERIIGGWLDTPLYSDWLTLLSTAAMAPVVVVPYFLLVELYRALRKSPVSWRFYVPFFGLLNLIAFAARIFVQQTFDLSAPMPHMALLIAGWFVGIGVLTVLVAAGISAVIGTLTRRRGGLRA